MPKGVKQKQYCNKFNKDVKNGPHQNKETKETPTYLCLPKGKRAGEG